jgi:hypothetical protein
MVTESTGDAVDGLTLMLAAAEAVDTDASSTAMTTRTDPRTRVAERRFTPKQSHAIGRGRTSWSDAAGCQNGSVCRPII